MDSHLNELQLDLEEIKKFEGLATREAMRGKLAIWKSQIEQEIEQIKAKSTQQQQNIVSVSSPKPKIYTKKITTYGWDQSDKVIKVFVSNLKGIQDIPRENIIVECKGQHCTLTVKELNNVNYILNLPKLLKDVSQGTCKVKTDEVILMLKKAKPGNWGTLSEKEMKEKEEKESRMKPELDKDEDPSKGIMSMMKKMYDDGDDDMKRMISKAWTESREKQMKGEE